MEAGMYLASFFFQILLPRFVSLIATSHFVKVED